MRSQSSIVVVVWLVALCCDVTGFSIRRNAAPKSDLSEAFRVLERHRRRIREDEYLAASRMHHPRDSISPSEMVEWDEDMPTREEQAWIQDAFGIAPYDDQSYQSQDFVDDREENPDSKTVEASKEELQSIFGDSVGENSPDRVDEGGSEQVEVVDESQHKNTKKESENLTEEEFKALMSAVEKLQKRALVKKDTKSSIAKLTTPDPQPVSKEEITALFEESSDDDKPTPAEEESNTDAESTNTINQETEPIVGGEEVNDDKDSLEGKERLGESYKDKLSNIDNYLRQYDYYNSDEKRRKRFTKRAPVVTPPDSVPLEEAYMKEIQRLRYQIQKLKLLSQLEDMENDALTQTLNEATLSQMEGTVSVKEFSSLEEAIKLEEALQDLKNGKVTPLIVQLVAASAIGDLKKRGEPIWKKEKRMDEADIEESYPMYPAEKRDARPDLLEGGYLLMPGDKRGSKRVQEKGEDRWYDRPAREDRSDEKQRYLDATNSIDEMVGRLAEAEIEEEAAEEAEEAEAAKEAEEAEEAENPVDDDENDDMLIPPSYLQQSDSQVVPYSKEPASHSGQCPSLSVLTDCMFADVQNLPIDDEARQLCNRHELCYDCGATAGVKQGECDNLYRGDAAILCNKDANCVIEAELFLQEMKLKHRYSKIYKSTCDNTCTADFIGI